MPTTTVVVPCYNEAKRLDVERFHDFASGRPGIRFLLVNDGSRDGTLDRLRQLEADDPRHFGVVDLSQNRGKAEAIRQGVLCAAAERPELIGYWDADLATPLEAIPQFVDVLCRRPDVSLVVGSRLPLLGRDIQRRPVRRLLGRVFAGAASAALRLRIRDTQCGAKLFRATPAMLSAFAEPFLSRWIFDVELLARLVAMPARPNAERRHDPDNAIYELPLDRWEDVAGSRLRRSDFVKAVAELARIWWRYLRPGARPYLAEFKHATKPEVDVSRRRAA